MGMSKVTINLGALRPNTIESRFKLTWEDCGKILRIRMCFYESQSVVEMLGTKGFTGSNFTINCSIFKIKFSRQFSARNSVLEMAPTRSNFGPDIAIKFSTIDY